MKVLHVFADTNIFLQCKYLHEVDWSEIGAYDQIEVLITRPVESEVSVLKSKGNERRASRAKKTSSLIRELMAAQGRAKSLRANPSVAICLRTDLRRLEPAPIELDYTERDDQLVGIAVAFQRENPEAQALLLSNDTGPVDRAGQLGVSARFPPESWLLPPEPEDTGVRDLRNKLERYKDQEPRIKIMLPDAAGGLVATLHAYEPLTPEELVLMGVRLTSKFPMCKDFGSTAREERRIERNLGPDLIGSTKEVWQPVPKEEIEHYEALYARWQKDCTKKLERLHALLWAAQEWPLVSVSIQNCGSRAADDALVAISARGHAQLRPPKVDDGGEAAFSIVSDKMMVLPQAPEPPKGSWKRTGPLHDLAFLQRSIAGYGIQDFSRTEHALRSLTPPDFHIQTPRDRNAFYFKKGGPGETSEEVQFECAQWRHAGEEERFEMSLVFGASALGVYKGVVQVTVEAANLTEPVSATLRYAVTVEASSTLQAAKKLIDTLTMP